jgi:hypothetical protein
MKESAFAPGYVLLLVAATTIVALRLFGRSAKGNALEKAVDCAALSVVAMAARSFEYDVIASAGLILAICSLPTAIYLFVRDRGKE